MINYSQQEVPNWWATFELERVLYKKLAAVIPVQEVSDRLVRIETHLSPETERILNRLELLRRMCKGQPQPVQVDVKISCSRGQGISESARNRKVGPTQKNL